MKIDEAQKIAIAAGSKTTAGGTYGTAYFRPGRAVGQVDVTNGTTGKLYFMLQASNSTSGIWFDLKAAASTVTSGVTARVCSTYACVFDRLRIETTAAQESTGAAGFSFWISAR